MDRNQRQDSTATREAQQALRAQVALVHCLRQAHATAKYVLDRRRRKWEQANADWIEQVRLCLEDMVRAEMELRTAALNEYHITGNKRPAPGVEVEAPRFAARVVLAADLGKALAQEGE